ncbi:hypothetical protein GC175_19670 [bacterium]|nr:hypothetical protein [bacterium]
MKKITLLVVVVAMLSLFTVGQAFAGQEMVELGSVVAQDATPTPEAEEEAEEGEMVHGAYPVEIPFLSAWMNSPHADSTSRSFTRWDSSDPQEIPVTCAKCHSTTGMLDYMGADGSDPLVVDAAAPVGTVVECMACHNDAATGWDSVVMPSGAVLSNLGPEARCMECHQGRASMVSITGALERVGATADDMDTVFPDLSFINIHYYAAAATKYGTIAKGGFEYPGQMYDAFFMHVPGVSSCTDCHNAHTTEIDVESCATCHEGVTGADDFKDIRTLGSLRDYDGDGDMEEGIYYEIQTLEETLYEAIRIYAAEVIEAPILYNPESHPYFFTDPDGDGEVAGDEERYASWTPRLLEAAYNYQVAHKDPGAYVHGGKYIIQLLYDSIASLNEAIETIAEPMDMTAMHRNDAGHFNGASDAFRHWDADGSVPGNCTKCHTADGLPFYLGEAVTVSGAPSNGLQCNTCHTDLETYEIYAIENVEFPSGVVLTSDEPSDNLCMQCHQGRASGIQIEARINGLELDEISDRLSFVNPHYFAAAATLYGAEANGAYQFEGKDYFDRFEHVRRADNCMECHGAHELEVDWEFCADCHDGVTGPDELVNIREYEDDFDGDGDVSEGIAGEIATMEEMLFEAIQAYAADTLNAPMAYDPNRFPYFFADADGDGVVSEGDGRFTSWSPRLLRNVYNYLWVSKDPGAYTHNGQYIIQTLYDSLEDLGVDVSGMTRP